MFDTIKPYNVEFTLCQEIRGDFLDYSIGEFSKLTGLGIHTLRYYEQENLIRPKRNAANRRCYSDSDIKWIDFIKRLKDTGMPIKVLNCKLSPLCNCKLK